jgi:hypothetical protein
LAERLNEVVPDGFAVRADGPEVQLLLAGHVVGGSSASRILDEDGDGLPEERVGVIAAAVLSGVQDDVAENLTEPWPVAGKVMANAEAEQSGDTVEMWFGDRRDPLIRLRSITLDLSS